MNLLTHEPDLPSVTVRDGDWTMTTNPNGSTAKILLRHRDWGVNEIQEVGPVSIARRLMTLRMAAEMGSPTMLGGGTWPILPEEIGTVLALLERVLPEWLAALTSDDWRGLRLTEPFTTYAMLDHYGVSHDAVDAALDPEGTAR